MVMLYWKLGSLALPTEHYIYILAAAITLIYL